MRIPFLAILSLAVPACIGLPGAPSDPPALAVTSPQRSAVQAPGALDVTGTIAPGPTQAPIASVVVNGTPAALAADGSYHATLQLQPGATLIHTVATDQDGGVATDTRSVEVGELRAPGASIERAIAASVSGTAFGKLAQVGQTDLASADLTALVAPLNPIVHAGDPMGPDCLYAEAFVDTFAHTGAKLSLAPVDGGLHIAAELDGVHITGHMNYAVACVKGSATFDIRADATAIDGVLDVAMNGMKGFSASLANPNVQLPGLAITATGIPGAILNILPVTKIIQTAAPKAATTFLDPMLNKALGALTGPQKLSVLGKTIDVQVAPSSIAFDPAAATVVLDMTMLIEGAEQTAGFLYTDNGMPTLDAGNGLALGVADDLANEALSQLVGTGLLDLSLPLSGGAFDSAQITPTSSPMISADTGDGKLRLVLPDMMLTFSKGGMPLARAALNAQVELAATQAPGSSTIAIQLGTPELAIDILEDHTSTVEPGEAAGMGTASQLGSITQLLQNIPLPQLAGLTLADTSVSGADGYVLVRTTLQ